jgi:hypothetical protein
MLSDVAQAAQSETVAVIRFPADASDPIVAQFLDSNVEILVAKRLALKTKRGIPRQLWAVPGVYVLLGMPQNTKEDPAFVVRARPGMAKGDLLRRLDEHLGHDAMGSFDRAVLLRSTRGFNGAEAGFVEGILHEACRQAVRVEHDFRRDSDESLQDWEKDELLARVAPQVRAILEFAAVPLETAEELEAEAAVRAVSRAEQAGAE